MKISFLFRQPLVKRSVSIVAFMCLPVFSLWAQDSLISFTHPERPPTSREILQWHEAFTYEVTYSFLKLGKVRVEEVKDTLYQGRKGWYLRTVITSGKGIPFVGREENHYHSIFELTGSLPHTLVFWTDNVDEKEYNNSRYIYDYKLNKVYAREEQERDTLALEEPASSGQLIFMMSRLFAGTNESLRIPIFLNLEKGYIEVSNTADKEMREYEAFAEPVETYYSEGTTTIEGPFGFRDEFKVWHLTDDLRVPVEAHVKVWLGNVKVKLIDYKKKLRK